MTTQKAGEGRKRQKGAGLVFYHANGTGTGAAAKFDPKLFGLEEGRAACFFLDMARQKTVASGAGEERAHATFDWENKVTVKLDFPDICQFLAVLEGSAESVGGKKEGIYHGNGDSSTLIHFKKHESGGFALGLSRKRDSEEANRVLTVLTPNEAVGLRHVLGTGLFFMACPMPAAETSGADTTIGDM